MTNCSLFFIFLFGLSFAQQRAAYNLIPNKNVEINEIPNKEKQLYKSKHWFGLKSNEADLLDLRNGYYPDFIDKIYYNNNYLGLNINHKESNRHHTYAVTPLVHKIKKGNKYSLVINGYLPYSEKRIQDFIRQYLKLHRKQSIDWNSIKVNNILNDINLVTLGYSLSSKEPSSLNDLAKRAVLQTKTANNYFSFIFDFVASEDANYLTIGNFSNTTNKNRTNFDKYVIIHSVNLFEQIEDNLIPNPNFEEYTDIPKGPGEWWRIKDWFSPHPNKSFHKYLPSPDLIHKKISGRDVISGNGTARVGYINMDTLVFNEALSTKLKSSLLKEKRYHFSYHLCPANLKHRDFLWVKKETKSDLDSMKIQFGFSRLKPIQGDKQMLDAEQILNFSRTIGITSSCERFSTDFVAKGNYDYLTIGYFEELDVPRFAEVGVYFDNLSIYEIPKEVNPEYFASLKRNNADKKQQRPVIETPKVVVEKPENKFNTKLELKHEAVVENGSCILEVYDHGTEDGDIISLVVNGEKIVENLMLRRRPNVATFDIKLNNGYNFIYPIAQNLGRIPPNTAYIKLNCTGQFEKEFRLFSKPGESEVLRIQLGGN